MMKNDLRALIVVDVQNDFCDGGALAVPGGDEVVPIINGLMQDGGFDLVVATQDFHPADHYSFASQHDEKNIGEVIELNGTPQVLWPDHCIGSTPGADFHPHLKTQLFARVFQKGQNRRVDSYSGFFDNDHQTATGLGDYLKTQNVGQVYLCGLATDYCVKFSVLDAKSLGFQTFLIEDASRGVNLQNDDVQKAIGEMNTAGVEIVQSAELFHPKT